MDQFHQNLNRYYVDPGPEQQPAIWAIKHLLNLYALEWSKLALYLDLHAHASKRGCFIYGNVMNDMADQVQNQMFCQLIALNTPHFDYDGCLFSRDHMTRIDPCDQAKGLTAEGSGRVATYIAYGCERKALQCVNHARPNLCPYISMLLLCSFLPVCPQVDSQLHPRVQL